MSQTQTEPELRVVNPQPEEPHAAALAGAGFSLPFPLNLLVKSLKPKDLLRFAWSFLGGIAASTVSGFLKPALDKASGQERKRLAKDARAFADALDNGNTQAAADDVSDVIASFRF